MAGRFACWLILALVASGALVATVGRAATAAAEDSPPTPVQFLRSPGGTIEVSIAVDGPLSYSVRVDTQPVIGPSKLGLKLSDGTTFGKDVELVTATNQSVDETWENPFGKCRVVRDKHNQLHLLLRERSAEGRTFGVVFRAFDDGVAFRYELLSQPGAREFILEQELTQFTFPGDYECYAGEHESKGVAGPQEWEFARRRLSDIEPDSNIGLPLLVQTPPAWVGIAEADLLDWSGMWLAAAPNADHSSDVKQKEPGDNAEVKPTDNARAKEADAAVKSHPPLDPLTADSPSGVTLVAKLAPRLDGQGLVKADTPHRSAWRVLMIGRWPGRLIESEIIRNLSTPSQLKDTSWIKPGMMAWDYQWTGGTNMTTDGIKEYIQLAAEMGWPYQLIDDGWYGDSNQPEADITKPIPALYMDEVRNFAKEKNVRLWLWLNWNDVERNEAYKKAFPLYQKWGIAGVKIDFMDRDDQEMVRWYEKITRAAAKHQLMVNFHGAMKPTGFDRTFPNQITREGVLGNVYNKWSARVTPEHKVTLPFTRYLLGPGDFTPGGFLNRQPGQFTSQKPALVQGTRAAELALFVVYDSPICCVCDQPDHYRDAAGVDFLKIVPTVWDNMRVLDGAVGEYLVIARQSGDSWYLGALTNSQGRDVDVKLDFLGTGKWKLHLWRDAADADKNAEHLVSEERVVAGSDTLTVRLAPAGGCVARFQKK
ncbi:MAG: glycoside hydrolase family 97 protein [Pirellulales bacterium]